MKEELKRIFSTLKNQIQNNSENVDEYISIAENEVFLLINKKKKTKGAN